MPRGLNRLLTRLSRLAALLVWVGQLGLVAAPLAETHVGESAAPHVESHGESRHAAHNPDLCYACTLQALLASPEPSRGPVPPAESGRSVPTPAVGLARGSADAPSARPRAPPVSVIAS